MDKVSSALAACLKPAGALSMRLLLDDHSFENIAISEDFLPFSSHLTSNKTTSIASPVRPLNIALTMPFIFKKCTVVNLTIMITVETLTVFLPSPEFSSIGHPVLTAQLPLSMVVSLHPAPSVHLVIWVDAFTLTFNRPIFIGSFESGPINKRHLPITIFLAMSPLPTIHVSVRVVTLTIPMLLVFYPHAVVTAFLLDVEAPPFMMVVF